MLIPKPYRYWIFIMQVNICMISPNPNLRMKYNENNGQMSK